MGIETSTTIAGLQVANPTPSDGVSQGDDHLRLIKDVLQKQFPGSGGHGFSTPITATEAEINYLTGLTSNLQAQLNVLAGIIPAGTRMLFFQANPPPGWALVGIATDYMIRVVPSGGGGFGGVDNPVLMDKVPLHNHVVNIGSTTIGDHTHGGVIDPVGDHGHFFTGPSDPGGSYDAGTLGGVVQGLNGRNTSGAGAHTHTATISAAGASSHGHSASSNNNIGGVNYQPRYINAILCEKL